MEPRITPPRPAPMTRVRSVARHPRHPNMGPGRAPVARNVLLVLALVLLATAASCGGPGPSASSPPSAAPVETPDAAVAAIQARTPWFDGIGPADPNLIGQAASWTAVPGDGPYIRVTFEVGWGDCQAGCIDRHAWTWDFATNGSVEWVGEDGSELSPEQTAALAAAARTAGVGGRVTGGPTCPVESPGDPACAPRLVDGAVLVVKDAGGKELARASTDASGFYRIALPAGAYTLEAAPVEGFMSGPAPATFSVADGALTPLDLAYDTGIR